MLKNKYKISAIAVCFLFFALALFSSAGFYPVKFLLSKTGFAGFNGVNWNDLKYSGNGILADEIPHIGGGYYYLKTGRYFINPEHPPLVKDIAGLGILLFERPQPAFPNITDQTSLAPDYHRPEYPFPNTDFPKALEWQNNQDHFGTLFLFHPQNNPDKIAFFARLAVILANTILLFILFCFLSKIWNSPLTNCSEALKNEQKMSRALENKQLVRGERAALLGLFFFAVSPFSIGHGSYVVIDFMSAVLSVIAVAAFALYLKKYAEKEKTGKYFFLAAFFLALALLSKFSSVVLVPALFAGGLIFFIRIVRDEKRSEYFQKTKAIFKYIFAFSAVMVATLFLVAAFYAFHVAKAEDSALIQKINENYPEEQLPQIGHKILEAMVWSNPLTKGLAAYVNGVFMVVSRMVVSAQNTYFLGHVYGNEGAGLWYFPVLYLAKLSPGMHFFSIVAVVLFLIAFVKKMKYGQEKLSAVRVNDPLPVLLWVFIFFYMAVTLRSTFQIGLRHIMPVILAAAVLTGRGTEIFWEHIFLRLNLKNMRFHLKVKYIFAPIAGLMLISVYFSFPYYLQYYNLFAGGTDKGYLVATDSNYDWGGSDVRRLAEWMRGGEIKNIYTQMFADVPLKYYLGDGQKGFNLQNEGTLPPTGSYIAVSNYEYMNNVYAKDIPPERKYTALKDNLVSRIGKTIFVFRVPQELKK